MLNDEKSNFPGTVGLIEPIIVSGKSLGIKLLSVYDYLRCEFMCRGLVEKLIAQGFDEVICGKVCEKACLVSICLYDSQNRRVFSDGLSVLRELTPEELQNVYAEYAKLNKRVVRFDKITSGIVNKIKRGPYNKIY